MTQTERRIQALETVVQHYPPLMTTTAPVYCWTCWQSLETKIPQELQLPGNQVDNITISPLNYRGSKEKMQGSYESILQHLPGLWGEFRPGRAVQLPGGRQGGEPEGILPTGREEDSRLHGRENAGYQGIGPEEGMFVSVEDAYLYALERCLSGSHKEREEFREMLVEWYYSGNWIKAE